MNVIDNYNQALKDLLKQVNYQGGQDQVPCISIQLDFFWRLNRNGSDSDLQYTENLKDFQNEEYFSAELEFTNDADQYPVVYRGKDYTMIICISDLGERVAMILDSRKEQTEV